MIRLSRAGRRRAIIDAISRLNKEHKNGGYYAGEICKKMGVTSQSKIKYILRQMVEDGILVSGTSAIDGYAHELEIFQIATYEQAPLPDHVININGQSYNSSDWKLVNA